MPELPEVETLKRELSRVLIGKKFNKVEILNKKSVAPLSPNTFSKNLIHQKIKSVDRRAKMLIIDLEGPLSLAVHLKMTGQLIYAAKNKKIIAGGHPENPEKYTRIIFTFTTGEKLRFNDLRKFGWVRLIDDVGVTALTGAVGVEPLSKDFSAAKLAEIIKKYPKRSIKKILLDQNLIAGIGNIYADEACFLSSLLPTRPAAKIKPAEIVKLRNALVSVLKLSISKKGTSSKNYVRSDGSRGGFVPHLKVYGRTGEPCKTCGTRIKKIKHAGRGTHFCPHCQK